MNRHEFAVWFEAHKAYFPDIAAYFDKLPNSADVISNWQLVLRDTGLESAKAASSALYEASTRPRSPADHAGAIKRLSVEIETKRIRSATVRKFGVDNETFRCRYCRDSGLVPAYCVGGRLKVLVRQYGRMHAAQQISMMNCFCPSSKRIDRVTYFDPDQHIRQEGSFAFIRSARQEIYERRMSQVDQAIYELENGIEEYTGFAPVGPDTEF